jgi:hypothetical protein
LPRRCLSAIGPTTELSRFPPKNFVRINKPSPCFVSPTIGESRTYAGKEAGGARPVRSMAGIAGVDETGDKVRSQLSSLKIKELIFAVNAGGVCHFHAGVLSLEICRIVRLLAGDSSVSVCMAQRSSVAEITGKRMTSRQPRVSRHCRELNLRPAGALLAPRHNQYAGSAKSSQVRLSSNSMRYTDAGARQRTPS